MYVGTYIYMRHFHKNKSFRAGPQTSICNVTLADRRNCATPSVHAKHLLLLVGTFPRSYHKLIKGEFPWLGKISPGK